MKNHYRFGNGASWRLNIRLNKLDSIEWIRESDLKRKCFTSAEKAPNCISQPRLPNAKTVEPRCGCGGIDSLHDRRMLPVVANIFKRSFHLLIVSPVLLRFSVTPNSAHYSLTPPPPPSPMNGCSKTFNFILFNQKAAPPPLDLKLHAVTLLRSGFLKEKHYWKYM